MLIKRSEPKILMPVSKWEWRERSAAQTKDQCGRQNCIEFRIEFWKRDGGLINVQYFDDRDEFDYALHRALIEEPHPDIVPMWFATTLITASPGGNLTYNVGSDWNNGNNKIECVGAGGRGGRMSDSNAGRAAGGGGGAYSSKTNFSATPGGTETYQIGAGAAALSSAANNVTAGVAGGDTWFGDASFASAECGAKGGSGGGASASTTTLQNGGAGGAAASGFGDVKTSGGRGGNCGGGTLGTNAGQASGGGGAAGPAGDGGNGVDTTTNITTLSGTAGGTGSGGAAGGAGSNTATGTVGTAGTNIGAGAGSGGGGGGGAASASLGTGATGGNYGGGTGGGMGNEANAAVQAGKQGAIWVTYTPVVANPKMLMMF